ncbi:MAG: hypothetical protein Q9171_002253 [Xanthocarpia ochracea]
MIGGGLVGKVGYFQPFLMLGACLSTIGAGLIYRLDIHSSAGQYIGYQILFSAGLGISIQVPVIAAQALSALSDIALVTASILFFQLSSGAFAVSAAQSIFNNQLISNIADFVPEISPGQIIQAGSTGIPENFAKEQVLGVLLMLLRTTSISAIVLGLINIANAIVVPRPNLLLAAKPPGIAANLTSFNGTSVHSLQRPPLEPFIWYLRQGSLALSFSAYGRDIDGDNFDSCLIVATKYIYDVLKAHGDGPIPSSIRLYWAQEATALSIYQTPRLTYDILAVVLVGIQLFQYTYGYFETHFEIIDHHTGGHLGSGNILSTQDSRPSQPASATLPLMTVENTLPTTNGSSRLLRPPNPPFNWPVPFDPTLTVRFTLFGHPIPEAEILMTYIFAAHDVRTEIASHTGDVAIPHGTALHWTSGTAVLTILHQPTMTWGVLADVLTALTEFGGQYGYTEASFNVRKNGREVLGQGTISLRRRRK